MKSCLSKVILIDPDLTKVIIRFHDLPTAITECKIILGIYRGLKWTGFCYGHESFLKRNYPDSGYATCFASQDSPQLAYFKIDSSIESERMGDMFTIVSIVACAAWNDNVQLTIIGLQNSRQTYEQITILPFGQPQLISLNWKNIEKILLKPSGGTVHPGSNSVPLPHIIITELTIDAVEQ